MQLNTKGFHIVHLNAQSCKNKLDLVKFHVKESNAEIFSLSETWLTSDFPAELMDIERYSFARLDRSWAQVHGMPKKGGGVACYIKSDLIYSTQKLQDLNVSCSSAEILWISIQKPHMKEIIVGIVYRPPQGNTKDFIDGITERVQTINTLYNAAEVFLLGDFNINYLNGRAVETKLLKEMEKETGLHQLITEPTRCARTNTLSDLIFTNCTCVRECGILGANISDHEAIYVNRKKEKEKFKITNSYGRSYINYSCQAFQRMLVNTNWTELEGVTDVNIYWEIIELKILKAIDSICPIKKIKVKDKGDPWMSQELIELIHDKDRMHQKATRTDNPDDWKNAYLLRNITKNRIKEVKADYIKDSLNRHKSDPSKFWKQMNLILPKKAKLGINLVDEDNNAVDLNDVANYINEYFVNIGPELAREFTTPWTSELRQVNTELNSIRTTVEEVLKLVEQIDCYKSSAISHLSSRVIKDAFLAIPVVITALFNLSLSTGVYPDRWKIAKVIPIHEGGNTSEVNNYRPVRYFRSRGNS